MGPLLEATLRSVHRSCNVGADWLVDGPIVPYVNVIALRLGHESTTTAHRSVEAGLAMKGKALGRLETPSAKVPPVSDAGRAGEISADAITMRSRRQLQPHHTRGGRRL